jgi:hypothetical protein
MVTIDTSTPFDARVRDRLQRDLIGWLTTIGPDGTPQPSPQAAQHRTQPARRPQPRRQR